MKKDYILNRITEIVKESGADLRLCQFGTEQNKFNTFLFVNKRGSISLHDEESNLSFPLSKYSKYTLSNILYEIGNDIDMMQVFNDVNPVVYALCMNILHKSVNDG
jgi:hypothetical protein